MGTLTDVPPPLLVGWSLWVVGGLLLLLWFMRQSAPRHLRDATASSRTSGTHLAAVRPLSGTHAAARPASGTHAAARKLSGSHITARQPSGTQAAVRPPSGVYPVPFKAQAAPTPPTDPFDDLRALLDPPDDTPQR